MKIKLETVTPEIARELLKNNTRNRKVREAHVDFLASEMANGRWHPTSETIGISEEGQIVDGQHRLLAILQSGCTLELWVARDVPMSAQDYTDVGCSRTVADQLHLSDGVKDANLVVGATRTIISLSCYYQHLKPSIGLVRMTLSEFGRELDFCITAIRPFRPGLKTWIVGSLAFAMSADRSTQGFIEDFGSGENLSKGSPAKAARDWLLNGSSYFHNAWKRPAIEGILNAAYNGVSGGSISSVKKGVQGSEYFLSKKRKFVATIREQVKHQISNA